jgi:hypothetical protein
VTPRVSLPAAGRHPGSTGRSSVRAVGRRQPRRSSPAVGASTPARKRGSRHRAPLTGLLWASVQPCTCSDGRLGFSGDGFGRAREPARLSRASFARATERTRRATLHRWVCSGFTSIAEVGEQCPAHELRCGCGRCGSKAPQPGADHFAPGERHCGLHSDVRASTSGCSSSAEGAPRSRCSLLPVTRWARASRRGAPRELRRRKAVVPSGLRSIRHSLGARRTGRERRSDGQPADESG